jgi:hypothetical protein
MNAPYAVGNFGSGQTVTTVSRQWLSRSPDQKFLSLGALKAAVDSRRERSVEATIDPRRIEFFAPEAPKTIEETHDLQVVWAALPAG